MLPTFIQILTLLAQFATVAGLMLLYRQIEVSRRASSAQLINELEKEFGDHRPEFAKLTPNGEWCLPVASLRPEQVTQLAKLVAFCEKLKHFLDLGTLSWRTLDLMFRARFFIIMNNPNVLKYVITPHEADWSAVLRLKTDWQRRLPKTDHRVAQAPGAMSVHQEPKQLTGAKPAPLLPPHVPQPARKEARNKKSRRSNR